MKREGGREEEGKKKGYAERGERVECICRVAAL